MVKSTPGATAMALLPFLAAGQTHKSKGPYQSCISKGVAWLLKQQTSEGDLSGQVSAADVRRMESPRCACARRSA